MPNGRTRKLLGRIASRYYIRGIVVGRVMASIADIDLCLDFGNSVSDKYFKRMRRGICSVEDDAGINPIDIPSNVAQ